MNPARYETGFNYCKLGNTAGSVAGREGGRTMNEPATVVIQGVESAGEVPGLDALAGDAVFRCASSLGALREALPGAEVLLGWNFAADDVARAFDRADRLRWIQWGGAGVDATLFPALIESDVVLTNVRGVFDQAMAEYTLGMILAFAKDFRRTVALQRERAWLHRPSEKVAGTRALVVGAGSIGRAIGRTLRAAGIEVDVVGRSARGGDPDFGHVYGNEDLDRLLGSADWVVLIAPLTAETRGMFGAARFAAMKPEARFFNLGRGALVDEPALIEALSGGIIAGAGLDVFGKEPLPAASPLWEMENVFVSPHMSGDFRGYEPVAADVFIGNFRRFRAGEPLVNVVDKRLGFVSG